MEEHEVATIASDLPQGQSEVSGAATASGWGTCEELLLVSAVKRHGVHNWNLISSELKARAISFNVSPLHFSETVCKHKYDVLRGRYASSSSFSMSQVEEVENDMQWFEELRKQRVAHLKRELEQYDGSIGSLQVKIKRLKAEKAQDTSLNKQLGKSIANPQSIHDVSAATSSCEVSNQLMTGLRPCSSSQEAVTALDLETTPYEQTSSQAATSSQNEVVVTDTDHWHDSVEEFQETSPMSTVITVDLDFQTDPHPCGSFTQHNSTEYGGLQDNAVIFVGKEVATEPPPLVGALGSGGGLEIVEAVSIEERKEFIKLPEIKLADSHQQDEHMVDTPAESLQKDNEAGKIGPDSWSGGDNEKLGIIEDLKICEEVSSEMEVVEGDSSVNAQVDYEQPERDRYSTAAIPVTITDTGIDGGDPKHGNPQDCSTIHFTMASSTHLLPNSSQSPESRTPDEIGEPHSKVSTTEEEATTSLDDGQNVSELHEGDTLEEDGVNEISVEVVDCPPLKAMDREGYRGSQPHVVVPLDTVDGHSSGVLERSTLNCADVENTNNVYTTDVRREHKIEDPEFTETPDDDVGQCTGHDESHKVTSQEQDLQSEVSNVEDDVIDPNVLKDTTILDPGSTEAGVDVIAAGEHVQIDNEPQNLELSAIVPIASLVSSENGVIRDGTIILLDNSDPKGNGRSPAGLVYLSDALSLGCKSLSPERHIIIALDEPSNDVLSCRAKPVLASNAGGQVPCKMGSYTGSEAPDADDKELVLENLNQSLGSDVNDAKTTPPANAMDLLREVYGTAHEITSELTITSTEDAATTKPSSITLSAEAIIPDTQNADGGDQTLLETSTEATYQLRNSGVSVEMHVPSKDAGNHNEENDLSFAGCKEPCYAGVGELEAGDPYKVSPSSNGQGSASPNLVLKLPKEECFQQVDGDSTIDPLGICPTTANGEDEPTEQKFATNNEDRELPGIVIDVKLDIINKDDDDAYDITTSDSKHSRVVSSDSLRGTSGLKNPTNALKGRDDTEEKEPKEDVVRKSKSHAKDSREGMLQHSIVIPKLEPSSPVESSAGGLESKIPSSHEGSDSVHELYKDSGDERRRGGTQNYGESHVFDKSEAGSPIDGNDAMSPSSRSNRKEPRVPGKLVPLLEVLRRLCSHKSAYLFKGRQEDSRYNLLIRRHLDLTIVRTRLEEGAYSGSKEFFRDLLLIFNNAMVYYPCGSVEFEGAKSLFAEATKEMERIFQTEALLNRDGPATRTRELKKPRAVVGVAALVPAKTAGGPPNGGATAGGKLINNPTPPVTSLPETNNRKRAGSRLGAVETSTNSGAVVESEGGAARSASVNPKVRSTTQEEAGDSQEDDQEVNGRLKLHKVGVSSRGRPPREELLEGILLKNTGGNKSTGRGAKVKDVKVLKEVKKEEVLKKAAVPAKVAAVGVKPKADKGGERAKVRVSEKEQRERDKEKGKEREDIDDDDVLRRGKSLSKLKDREVVICEREPGVFKPALKARASTAARPALNNPRDTLAQSLVRPSRGGRKSAVEPSRPPPESQPKKRVRK